MKLLLLVILSWLVILPCFSQDVVSNPVSNVRSEYNEATRMFRVTYDLDRQGKVSYFDVKVIVYISSVRIDPSVAALSGDVGPQIRWGKNKSFIWDAFIDVARIDGEVKFVVEGKANIVFEEEPKIDLYVGGGTSAVGAGLLAFGVSKLLGGDVKQYKTDCDPESESLKENMLIINSQTERSPCDDAFDAANSNFKTGQILAIAGVIVGVGGAYILMKKPFLEKWQKEQGQELGLRPALEFRSIDETGKLQSFVGLQAYWNF